MYFIIYKLSRVNIFHEIANLHTPLLRKQKLQIIWSKFCIWGATTMGNSTAFPQKIKNRLRYNPAIPLLGVYPDEKKKKH